MAIQVGDVVAYCYSGTHGTHRIRNLTITKVMKTFIETDDGTRFSTQDFRQKENRSYHIDVDVAYWDDKEAQDKAIRTINTGFESLISAARERNWKEVKACFNALAELVDK